MSHFRSTESGIEVLLSADERTFLGDVLPMLAAIGSPGTDPAADRLRVPVYPGDPEADQEWWRLMGEELDAARRSDRAVFARMVESTEPLELTIDEGDAVTRVLNEARLALGARLGIEVEDDYGRLSEEGRAVLGFLGWLQEELVDELSRSL